MENIATNGKRKTVPIRQADGDWDAASIQGLTAIPGNSDFGLMFNPDYWPLVLLYSAINASIDLSRSFLNVYS